MDPIRGRGRAGTAPKRAASRSPRRRRRRPEKAPSKLAAALMLKFSTGELSPQIVQVLADAGMTDIRTAMAYASTDTDFTFVGLERLSNLGTHGQYANNMNKQIMQIVDKEKLGQPFHIDIPYKVDPNGIKWLLSCIVLPHILFASIYNNFRERFFTHIVHGGREHLNCFWDNMSTSAQYLAHPIRLVAGHRDWAVPLTIHGDETPITGVGKSWCNKSRIYTWRSIVGIGTYLETSFLLWEVFEKFICEEPMCKTRYVFWRILVHSFNALASGRHPTRHPLTNELYDPESEEGQRAGTLLAGGFCGLVWGLIGDLEYNALEYRLPSWSNTSLDGHPCSI